MKNNNTGFRMSFDKNTIDHLGIKLYSQFPPVIAELISNAYDAEAEKVLIEIDYTKKNVKVIDDGHGMTHSELNESFLKIGRNRRVSEGTGMSKNKKRKVTGKKGLGKLSILGVAKTIEIESVSNGFENSMRINYDDLKNTPEGKDYEPEALSEYKETSKPNGTVIIIGDISLKNITPIENLASSLAKRFNFFDDSFQVIIKDYNAKNTEIKVTRNLYYDSLKVQFDWTFPDDFSTQIDKKISYKRLFDKGVNGKIITTETPLNKSEQGFNIYARKKMAAQSIFFDDRSNDNFNSYVTGYFNLDFIDEDNNLDYISTDRQSILWDQSNNLKELQVDLNQLVKDIGKEWRKKRGETKEKKLEEMIPSGFFDDLNPVEKKELKKIQKALTSNATGEEDIKGILNVLGTVKDLYQFESFQSYINELENTELTIENVEQIASDWERIETKELSKIAQGRIEAIKKFEKFVNNDESETKVIQPFLEKFPWILDPRISSFEREKYFSRILKERFPDEKLEVPNRRIDFLCTSANGGIIIIELKRPSIVISREEIEQVHDYREFVEDKYRDDYGNKIECILVSDSYTFKDNFTKNIVESLEKDNKLSIKSYTALLNNAKIYNQEYINMYEALKAKKP